MIKALSNNWLFHRTHWADLAVADRYSYSVATFESEEAEKAVVEWVRNHPRRPLTEWSELTDPFEAAGRADWSPVRSVRLATAGRRPSDPDYIEWLALRRQRRREAQEAARSS